MSLYLNFIVIKSWLYQLSQIQQLLSGIKLCIAFESLGIKVKLCKNIERFLPRTNNYFLNKPKPVLPDIFYSSQQNSAVLLPK